jgi:RimJ/RimL family protein N-acetyltransferase
MRRKRIVSRFIVNGDNVVIRYPKKRDLEGLLEAVRDRLRDRESMGGKIGRISQGRRAWWTAQLLTGRKAKRVTLLLVINNNVQGSIVVKKTRTGFEHYAPWWVNIIFVTRGYRGKGLGGKLFRAAISESRRILSARKIGLSVAAPNVRAVKLYLDCGFKEVKVEKNGREWHGRRVDWIRMVKRR